MIIRPASCTSKYSTYEYYGGCLIKGRHCLPFSSIWVHPRLWRGSWWSSFCVVLLVVCRRPVSCVHTFASVCGLSILDFPFSKDALLQRVNYKYLYEKASISNFVLICVFIFMWPLFEPQQSKLQIGRTVGISLSV